MLPGKGEVLKFIQAKKHWPVIMLTIALGDKHD